MEPGYNKSYVFDKKDRKNIEQYKSRITLILGANSLGKKLKPLLIR